ncbi:cell division cycle protein 16 homolog isoform X8 [Salmo salar]|uniref:Cell division cycle protein 16 homolog isoform X8 n=1 Tax=Salmo salar TaxID=8030 RepID=A0ABM3DNE7_SALSA|nr:cell division cycle protein 16 homolog isoform X8 [Salmo salar]
MYKGSIRTITMNLDRLRKRVRHYIDQQQYQSALFWADKIASLSHVVPFTEDPQDIYWLAQCLYLTSQYHRASHALRSRKLDQLYGACQYLAARCHYAAKEFQQALDILDMEEPASKELLDRSVKEDHGIQQSPEDWEMSPASYNKPSDMVVPEMVNGLQDNLDVVVSIAERHYYNCDFKMCYKLTSMVMVKDPFHANCLPVHIGTLVELSKANELFYLSHKLVDLYPNNPVSWFAVGCYYLMVGHKNEHARRYLSKATTLERTYGPAWIAYGHSFAVESEHDQAMAAYFTAAQLMKGCHLPLLYIGLEYGLTNNSKLAERFFSQALSIAPEDPFVMHEVAVVAFQNGDWKTAEKLFLDAMDKIKAIGNEVTVDKWEPLLNNLGHVCRKLKKYDQALEYHRQALVLIPQHASTYSVIGYVHSLMGDFESAIDYFHTALGLKRDDTFSVTMLGHCIEMYIGDTDTYIGQTSYMGTDIKDKVRGTLSTPVLMKMLNMSTEPSDARATPLLEESGIMVLETLPSNQDKVSLDTPLRRSLPLECDMYESDMMLETSMSDTST